MGNNIGPTGAGEQTAASAYDRVWVTLDYPCAPLFSWRIAHPTA